MKKCLKCKLDKELIDFYQSKRNIDGYLRWCKQCCLNSNKNRYNNNNKKITKKIVRQHTKKGEVLSKDFTGQKFNDWLIIKKISNNLYLCRCSCGFEKNHDIYYLRTKSNSNKSCRKCSYKRKNSHSKNLINVRFFTKCKYSAKKRSISFNITREFLYDLFFNKQQEKCALTGLKLIIPDNTADFENGACTASIDRIDSSKDYSESNVQIVHKDINIMKWSLTQKEFIEYCKLVSENNKETT